MGEKKKMGKNGHWAKKSKIPFFSKEKNGRTQKKKRAKNRHFKKKCRTTSKPSLICDYNPKMRRKKNVPCKKKKKKGKKKGAKKKRPFFFKGRAKKKIRAEPLKNRQKKRRP